MENTNNVLTLTKLSKSFPMADTQPVEVLKDISLSLESGKSMALVGPSGSGKSTLLNIIAGLDTPSSGHVTLAGDRLDSLGENDRAVMRRTRIGMVFQDHHLMPQLNVIENATITALVTSDTTQQRCIHQTAQDLIKTVGLEHRINHFPAQLSGGERQRLAVIRALCHNPQLVLADEPTGALDQDNATTVFELLSDLCATSKASLILVTHDTDLAKRTDSQYTLRQGTCCPL